MQLFFVYNTYITPIYYASSKGLFRIYPHRQYLAVYTIIIGFPTHLLNSYNYHAKFAVIELTF